VRSILGLFSMICLKASLLVRSIILCVMIYVKGMLLFETYIWISTWSISKLCLWCKLYFERYVPNPFTYRCVELSWFIKKHHNQCLVRSLLHLIFTWKHGPWSL
jgi:hypothetical protein